MAGIALTVAEQNARESGLNAIHNPHPYQQHGQSYAGDRSSHSSLQGLSAAPLGSGYATPGQRTPSRLVGDIYTDDPYQNLSRHQDSRLGIVNPLDIADDGDDGLEYGRKGPRTSMLSVGSSNRGHGTAAAGGAGAGGMLGGLVGRNGSGSVNTQYAPVNNGVPSDGASGRSGGGGIFNAGPAALGGEKPWQADAAPKSSGKKWKIVVCLLIAVAIIAGIVLGIVFGVVLKQDPNRKAGVAGSGTTAEEDTAANGDLNINSKEIKALMNNPDLHKVFVGMDYTPLNTQYPDCVHNPASQNNITRDLAVLSQLTNVVRLYGTDCNQTQMLIHAVDQLKLKDTVKIWLGVWQDKNTTTNARQLDQMWDILEEYGESYFKGVIVANEILFREEMTITALGTLLEEVRTNLTARGMSLPVATSDLGDKWDKDLAAQSDAIMANIHPFFAGEPVATAADWTMYFWGNKTGTFQKSDDSMNIIAETGWPSAGGMACGNEWETDCPNKAVAGIDEMNVFLEDWVCRALDDGTEYLWFEAFDEPWKVRFNTEGKEWEDKWGLFTVNRELKEGLKIPDCGGKRVR
jgi:exo-beta-1,3-glucanase (GH17 family)